jgi:hypothetical protein
MIFQKVPCWVVVGTLANSDRHGKIRPFLPSTELIVVDGFLNPSPLPTRFDSDGVSEMLAVFSVTREEGEVRFFW